MVSTSRYLNTRTNLFVKFKVYKLSFIAFCLFCVFYDATYFVKP